MEHSGTLPARLVWSHEYPSLKSARGQFIWFQKELGVCRRLTSVVSFCWHQLQKVPKSSRTTGERITMTAKPKCSNRRSLRWSLGGREASLGEAPPPPRCGTEAGRNQARGETSASATFPVMSLLGEGARPSFWVFRQLGRRHLLLHGWLRLTPGCRLEPACGGRDSGSWRAGGDSLDSGGPARRPVLCRALPWQPGTSRAAMAQCGRPPPGTPTVRAASCRQRWHQRQAWASGWASAPAVGHGEAGRCSQPQDHLV